MNAEHNIPKAQKISSTPEKTSEGTYKEILRALSSGTNKPVIPTNEQRSVIISTAPSLLVLAGAGSGKTATMTQRIAYMIGSKQVKPSQVLGLTFTRKAAGELEERVNGAIGALARAGILNFSSREGLARPLISTYNSFAQRIGQEYSPLEELQLDARLITEAERRQIMDRVLDNLPTNLIVKAHYSKEVLAKTALDYVGRLNDNARSVDELEEFFHIEEEALARLYAPYSSLEEAYEGAKKEFPKKFIKLLSAWEKDGDRSADREIIVQAVREYQSELKDRHLEEFSTQVLRARDIAREVGDIISEKYRLVLLDEYQDTSPIQAEFLSYALGRPIEGVWRSVCAVGDPNQAIYGWRGASARAFSDFNRYFHALGAAEVKNLSISFRNFPRILDAANELVAHIPEKEGDVKVAKLTSGMDSAHLLHSETEKNTQKKTQENTQENTQEKTHENTKLEAGHVREIHTLTRTGQAHAIAARIREVFREWEKKHSHGVFNAESYQAGPEIAILCRTNTEAFTIADELSQADIQCEVVGSGSLILRPEIQNVIALLRVAFRGDAGALFRLYTYVGLGVADIQLVHQYSQLIAGKNMDDATLSQRMNSLLEALVDIEGIRDYPEIYDALSDLAFTRLRELSRMIKTVQSAAPRGVEEVVRRAFDVLYTRTIAASRLTGGREVLGACTQFIRTVYTYVSEHTAASVEDFLAWVDALEKVSEDVEEESSAEEENIEVTPGIVQILTVHKAKGLEWSDLVIVPNMNEQKFSPTPSANRSQNWVSTITQFPYPLRKDYLDLPQFTIGVHPNLPGVSNHTSAGFASFKEAAHAYQGVKETEFLSAFEREESRVAYVALTRAKGELFLTSYLINSTSHELQARLGAGLSVGTIRKRSEFLQVLLQAEITEKWQPEEGVESIPGTVASEDPELTYVNEADLVDEKGNLDKEIVKVYVNENRVDFAMKTAQDEARDFLAFISEANVQLAREHEQTAVFHAPFPLTEEEKEQAFSLEAIMRRNNTIISSDSESAMWPQDVHRSHSNRYMLARPEGAFSDWDEQLRLAQAQIQEEILKRARARSGKKKSLHELPFDYVTAIGAVHMMNDRERFIRDTLRPIPSRPQPTARIGTRVHEQIAEFLGASDTFDFDFFDAEEEDGADFTYSDAQSVQEFFEVFTASRWASLPTFAVEEAIDVKVGGISVRCKLDAVFNVEDYLRENPQHWSDLTLPKGTRAVIVDWKSGARPRGKVLAQRALQLSLYRIAWAKASGMPRESIAACFFYLAEKSGGKHPRKARGMQETNDPHILCATAHETFVKPLSEEEVIALLAG